MIVIHQEPLSLSLSAHTSNILKHKSLFDYCYSDSFFLFTNSFYSPNELAFNYEL